MLSSSFPADDSLIEDVDIEVAAEAAEVAENMALALAMLALDSVLSALARSGADALTTSAFVLEEALMIIKQGKRQRKKELTHLRPPPKRQC